MESAKPATRSSREALINAGIVVFGRDGYAQASNRTIADMAGVNQALIKYNFGNKEQFYLAVFEAIADRMGQLLTGLVAEINATIEAIEHVNADRQEACILCIEKMLCRHGRLMIDPEMNSIAQLIMREQLEPTGAFKVLYGGMLGKYLKLLTRLIMMAAGARSETNEHRLSALMLMGQIFIFRAGRATVMHHMNWKKGIGEREFAQIEARLKAHVRALISGIS